MSGTFTTAFPTSLKAEGFRKLHDFTAVTGDSFKAALGKATSALIGSYGPSTTNYSDMTGNGDEVVGPGYTVGGYAWPASQNITPTTSGTSAFWQWSVDPSWTSATFVASGVLIYNSSSGNRAVYVGDLGGNQNVVSGTITLLQPPNGAGSSLLQIN